MRYSGNHYLKYSEKLITSLEKDIKLLSLSNDIEIIHRIRASTRKLRGIIRLFSLPEDVEDRLKSLADSLNFLRDLEVQLELISGYPEFSHLREEKLSQWEREKNRAIKTTWDLDLSQLIPIFSKNLKGKIVASLEAYEKLKKTLSPLFFLLKNIREGENIGDLLHPLRIRLKKTVYLLEALSLKNPLLTRQIGELKKYQDILGEIHDFHLLNWREKEEEKCKILILELHAFEKIISQILFLLKKDVLRDFPDRNLKNLLLNQCELDFLTSDFQREIERGEKISQEFSPDMDHISRVQEKSLVILEALDPLFSFTQEERHLLRLSALLHDTGHYLGDRNHNEESRNILYRSRFIGLDFISKIKIGWIIRNHRGKIEDFKELEILGKDERKRIKILAGILRTGDGMELESLDFIRNYRFTLKERELLLICEDISETLKKRFLSKSRYLARRGKLSITLKSDNLLQ